MWDISVFEVPHNIPTGQENAIFVYKQMEL